MADGLYKIFLIVIILAVIVPYINWFGIEQRLSKITENIKSSNPQCRTYLDNLIQESFEFQTSSNPDQLLVVPGIPLKDGTTAGLVVLNKGSNPGENANHYYGPFHYEKDRVASDGTIQPPIKIDLIYEAEKVSDTVTNTNFGAQIHNVKVKSVGYKIIKCEI